MVSHSPAPQPGPHADPQPGPHADPHAGPHAEPPSAPSWAGRSPAQRRADRRRRLLDAGRVAFGEEGFAGSAIRRICQAARVTERDLYREFGGKEGLLIAVYDELIADAFAAVTDALASSPLQAEPRLRAAVVAFTHATTADEATSRIHFVEVVGASTRIEAHRREVLRTFGALIAEQWRTLHAAGAIDRPPVPGLSMALVGATQELLLDALDGPAPHDLDAVVDAITRVHLAVLRHA